MPSTWGRIYRVHENTPYERPPSRIHDVSQIYQKAPSSQVVTRLLTFSEMVEPVLACIGPEGNID